MTDRLMLDDLLVAHAAGRLPEPVGILVASYLALSPDSRKTYDCYEALGGAMLDRIEPVAMRSSSWESLIADDWARENLDEEEPKAVEFGEGIPTPLGKYLPCAVRDLPWRRLGPVKEWEVPLGNEDYRVRLFNLDAGKGVPQHTHEGQELTLVIQGGFSDGVGHYERGDLAIADHTIDHQPVADKGHDCLSLTVTDAPLRLTGRFGRFFNPFLRF